MTQRITYYTQIIEKIGAPLLAAIASVSAANPLGGDKNNDASADAQKMAELLGKSVQLSIELGQATGLSNAPPEQAESLRVALAGLAGPIVAEQYRQVGRIPADQDIKRVSSALEAVMTFSENFTPSDDAAKRLATVAADGTAVDSHQTNVQIIQAFVPVISAIAAFPFGQQEKKLIQEVSTRLLKKAQEIRENFFAGETNEDNQKTIELGIIKGLAQIYTDCHSAEMNRMMKAEGAADHEQTGLEKVWADFDLRADMLESLSTNMMGNAGSSSVAQSSVAPPVAPAPIAPPVTETPAAAPPPADPTPAQTAESSGAGPMGFFKKPDEESDSVPPSSPPADPPPAPPAPPTESTPPPAAPATAPPSESSEGGNPMGFFKKPGEQDTPTTTETPATAPPPVDPQPTPPEQPPATPETPTQPPADSSSETPSGNPMGFFKKPQDGEE